MYTCMARMHMQPLAGICNVVTYLSDPVRMEIFIVRLYGFHTMIK